MRTISEETKAKELSRLVTEFDFGERQNRNEAWNLIAEFAYDNAEEICEALALRNPPSGEAGEVDLRTLVPGFRLDWSGLRNRLEEDLARLEKLDTYEMRAAHLDEMARQFEDAIRYALPTIKEPTDGKWGRQVFTYEHSPMGDGRYVTTISNDPPPPDLWCRVKKFTPAVPRRP